MVWFVANPFPNLRSFDDTRPSSVSHWHWVKLRKVADVIRHRTGARSWFDTIRKELCVGIDASGYPRLIAGWPVKSTDGLIEYDFQGIEPVSVDDIVYTVQLAAVDESRKDRWLAAHKKRREDEESKRRENHFLSVAPDIVKDGESKRRNIVSVLAS